MALHMFEPQIAKEYGVNAAIIFQNLAYWIEHNRANETSFHDGRYWTYNSVRAFAELFPYLTDKQIRGALKKLEDGGMILSGNYNKSAYDRTRWYALAEKGLSICTKGQMNFAYRENENAPEGEPIPDINTNVTTPCKPDISAPKKEPRHKYGEYENVLLSDTDLEKLKKEFPTDWEERIERLSAYIASTGKSYKSHLATIRNWARRDSEARKKTSRNESHWQKTEEEKQDEEAWMRNVIQC
ncbi:hypothetical protein [uncultured Senegalimassilia sp.]|uniref:hypothetical protein n=1 Tax=uncultured Senegalimassilia sp. TaxID=1714350 RepID=UPI002606CD39|nr:hypothetical protein [uncultured Senegalimassilia sp.]